MRDPTILGSLYEGSYYFGVYVRAPDSWQLPYGLHTSTQQNLQKTQAHGLGMDLWTCADKHENSWGPTLHRCLATEIRNAENRVLSTLSFAASYKYKSFGPRIFIGLT